MQLFICPEFQVSGNQLIIKRNPELIQQLRKVLRAQMGYQFAVQAPEATERYFLRLQKRSDQELQAEIVQMLPAPLKATKTWMLLSLPNKQEKLELIIQKFTEIGIDEIYLWASERSVLKSINPNKLQRLSKIMQEATEQSWNRSLPKLSFIEAPQTLHQERRFIVFDLPSTQQHTTSSKASALPLLGVVGPEGGLTERDYQSFPNGFERASLWDSVLRMETAAIIWAWKLKNLKN